MGKFKTAKKMINMSNRRTPFPSILLPILVCCTAAIRLRTALFTQHSAPSVTIAPSGRACDWYDGSTHRFGGHIYRHEHCWSCDVRMPVTRHTQPRTQVPRKLLWAASAVLPYSPMHCSACHSSNLAGMTCTANQWKELIDQMISQGAQLTPQEKQVLIVYLAATYHP
jgi:hypothetical protein